MLEKERKFLIKDKFNISELKEKYETFPIKQAYLMLGDNGKQLRIRFFNSTPFICYKYKVSNKVKEEFEFIMNDLKEAHKLYNSAELKLEKDRTYILIKDNYDSFGIITLEIDSYKNGLIVAEVEYSCSEKILKEYLNKGLLKEVLGKEITGIKKYSNVELAKEFTNN